MKHSDRVNHYLSERLISDPFFFLALVSLPDSPAILQMSNLWLVNLTGEPFLNPGKETIMKLNISLFLFGVTLFSNCLIHITYLHVRTQKHNFCPLLLSTSAAEGETLVDAFKWTFSEVLDLSTWKQICCCCILSSILQYLP